MSFELLKEKKPSCSLAAMLLIVLLSALVVAMAIAFAYLLLTGRGDNYELGSLAAFEFLLAGVLLVVYAKSFSTFREVAEDREETVLW